MFSHVTHIVPIDTYVYTSMSLLCAIHIHSVAKDLYNFHITLAGYRCN